MTSSKKWKFQLTPLSPPPRPDSKDSKVHKFPETSRQALDTMIISAFRKPNKLVVDADSFSFNIEFSCDEVDVAAASASIDEDLVLLANLTSPSQHRVLPPLVQQLHIFGPSSPLRVLPSGSYYDGSIYPYSWFSHLVAPYPIPSCTKRVCQWLGFGAVRVGENSETQRQKMKRSVDLRDGDGGGKNDRGDKRSPRESISPSIISVGNVWAVGSPARDAGWTQYHDRTIRLSSRDKTSGAHSRMISSMESTDPAERAKAQKMAWTAFTLLKVEHILPLRTIELHGIQQGVGISVASIPTSRLGITQAPSCASSPIIRVLMTNYYNLVSPPESLEPLPRVKVYFVNSNPSIHEIRIKFPENLRQALVTTIISAFRKLNKLVVHVDSYKFEIVFFPREVDVAAASALINEDLELLIRVRRLGWLRLMDSLAHMVQDDFKGPAPQTAAEFASAFLGSGESAASRMDMDVTQWRSTRLPIVKVSSKIATAVDELLSKQQKALFWRQQLAAINAELQCLEPGNTNLCMAWEMDEVHHAAAAEARRLKRIPPQNAERGFVRTYLEWLISLPWTPPATASDTLTRSDFLTNFKSRLDVPRKEAGTEQAKAQEVMLKKVIDGLATGASEAESPKENTCKAHIKAGEISALPQYLCWYHPRKACQEPRALRPPFCSSLGRRVSRSQLISSQLSLATFKPPLEAARSVALGFGGRTLIVMFVVRLTRVRALASLSRSRSPFVPYSSQSSPLRSVPPDSYHPISY
ncbi:hypothetical protein EDB86DRAFT_3150137 [Lactarius hatsudake]|nr:hypothetical protein EDB86DRAFT_3150137 [Lactarius hatsudake]